MTVKQERQPTALVKEVLIGRGILIDNVHFAGNIQALGEFSFPAAKPFFESGIVLSTGNATDLVGPNDNPKTSTVTGMPGDKNLYSLAGGRTFDGAKLSFDFKADRDSVTLNFVFASEEYHDYVGSSFNDVFAVVVSGTGFGTGKNLAVLPGTTTPITVNTVNPNENREYFVDNNPFTLVGRVNETAKAKLDPNILANVEYDGFTKTFSVGFRVVPKQVYHFEIVVSDAGDGTVDSAVLLEGGSFRSLEQEKHALRRAQLAEQRRQDSLARVQIVADSLERAAMIADSIAVTAQAEAEANALRIRNQQRMDSMARVEQVRIAKHRQDSILKAQEEQTRIYLARQAREDSLASINQAKFNVLDPEEKRLEREKEAKEVPNVNSGDNLPDEPKVPAPQPPTTETRETMYFDPGSYFVSPDGVRRLQELGKMLANQPTLRAGIYLPNGEPTDILNMRYDMMRFEMLKAGAKSDQIFRNGFSFAQPSGQNSLQRGEVWIRRE